MKTVLVFSGGLDSTVLLYHLLAEGVDVAALSVNYGQKHLKELAKAEEIARLTNVEQKTIDLTSITEILSNSSLTDKAIDIPYGHYEEENMKSTVVPNRNMILLSLATAWAISL